MANRSLHPLLHYLRRLSGGGDSDLDDAQLLRRFLSDRDETAFTTIVQRYGAMVWALCVRRLGETSEAEDAFQATFLVLVRKASSLRGPELLGPWLHGVAYRTALKLRGQRARQAARESPLPEQPAEERPEQVWSDLRPVIDEEVNRLPEKYRRPVVLCYLQGLSSEEAAQRLGCAKGTIFSRLSRARDLLRRRLSKRGLGVSAGALAAVLTDNAIVRATPPAALSEATIRTSVSFAASQALSAPLAALVEGVLRSMFLGKVKFAAIVFLVVMGMAGIGASFFPHPSAATPPAAQLSGPSTDPAGTANSKVAAPAPPQAKSKLVRVEQKVRLRTWREKLNQPVRIGGFDDPKTTLMEALDALAKRYDVAFQLNLKAFQAAALKELVKFEIASPIPIPEMHTTLATLLKIILDRLPARLTATFIFRHDFIEITTTAAVRDELKIPANRPLLPLVWDVFEDIPIALALERQADTTGYNVVVDSRVADKLQTTVAAQLNNVPVDTAVRLLANMADLSVVRLDNVFYVTTAENVKRLREEQAKINGEEAPMKPAVKPAPDKSKPAK